MLAIVVAILFILVVLVMALHTSQSRAVRNVTQAEAELQFRQGFEFAAADELASSEPLPDWLKVRGETDTGRVEPATGLFEGSFREASFAKSKGSRVSARF